MNVGYSCVGVWKFQKAAKNLRSHFQNVNVPHPTGLENHYIEIPQSLFCDATRERDENEEQEVPNVKKWWFSQENNSSKIQ